ncbi:MAG: non-ribosomal peptide synthetase, partial [bacterium]|nr:non-ribosomal peptide synthetase [bacterium]
EINGITTGDCLNLGITYSGHEYHTEEMETLIGYYKEALQEIISHCKTKKEKTLTPSDLNYTGITIPELEALEQRYARDNKQISDIYLLSPMQENMLFHALGTMENTASTDRSTAYFEQMSLDINGTLELKYLRQTFNKLVEKHDVLRTVFLHRATSKPVQVLLKESTDEIPNNIHYEDLAQLGTEETKKRLKQFEKTDRERGFQLEDGPLMRIALFRTGETTARIIWSFYHILMDGWCLGILFKEFIEIYQRLKQGSTVKEPAAEERVVPYVRYINWLQQQDKQTGLDHWAEYLQDYEQQAQIPKQAKAAPGVYRLKKALLQIDGETTHRMNLQAAKKQVTLNTLFQTCWGILLQKYNNTDDVVFGTIVAGRPPEIEGVAGMVGLFINTVPVRIKLEEPKQEQQGKEKGEAFTTLIKRVQRHTLESRAFEYLPLAALQAQTYMKDKLIDHIYAFENFPVQENIEEAGTESDIGFDVTAVEMFEQTNYDFNIMIIPSHKQLTVQIIYNAAVHEPGFINRLLKHLETVIRQTADNPAIETRTIEILTPEEQKQILYEFNDTHQEYPHEKTIHQLFEDQVERTPDSISLVG